MLSVPEDGWTDFQLGSENTKYSLSFLTDVAVEWLDQAIHGLTTLDAFSVHGFCEPGRMVCTVSYWNCYVIFEGDGREDNCESVYTVHISMIDFCRKLYADISGSLEAWVRWDDDSLEEDGVSPEEAVNRRRAEIQGKLDALKKLIEENAGSFDEDGCFF